MIEDLSKPTVQKFIRDHENDDPYEVTLKFKEQVGVPSKYLAKQIAARKKVQGKLPAWYSTQGLVYPSPSSVEQASSEITAEYKSQIFQGKHIIDLTGGMGVDTASFASVAEQVDYIEKDPLIADCALHNLNILGYSNIHFFKSDATHFLNRFSGKADGIYIDPLRRNKDNRVFLFEESEPDVILLQDLMLQNAVEILIKASPMIDIKYGLNRLKNVKKVYVVSIKNEVKEILFLSGQESILEPEIVTVNFKSNGEERFSFKYKEELSVKAELSEPLKYLYEPNATILKSGPFNLFGERYDLKKLHPNSHLYTSAKLNLNIPGRSFKINKSESFKGGKGLKNIKQANITTRNFKLSAEEIKKRFGIKDGGQDYLFFTTDMNGDQIVLYTGK